MCAGFDYFALLQHDDAIRFFDGGQTVCDNQRSATPHQSFQCGLYMAFRFAVQRGGGFIENEDVTICSVAYLVGSLDKFCACPSGILQIIWDAA